MSLIAAMQAARAAEADFNRWPKWKRELPVWSGAQLQHPPAPVMPDTNMQTSDFLNILVDAQTEASLGRFVSLLPRSVVIGLAGPKGSGKSMIAGALHAHASQSVRRYRFADGLKRMLLALGLTAEQIDGPDKDKPCDLLGGGTPRHAMQTLGTEWGRDTISSNLWVNACMQQVAVSSALVHVIDDVRFSNEAEAIHKRGGVVIEVVRPGYVYNPEHASEIGLPEDLVDYSITNDGTPLSAAIHAMLRTLHKIGAGK
jgi:hypothetical protein